MVGQGQVPYAVALAMRGRRGRAGVGRTNTSIPANMAHGRSGALNRGHRISGWGIRIRTVKSTSTVGNTVTERDLWKDREDRSLAGVTA